MHLGFMRPGQPVENGHIESFNSKLRDECLNAEVFFNLTDARRKSFLGMDRTKWISRNQAQRYIMRKSRECELN